MFGALTYVGCSVAVVTFLTLLYGVEDARGKRLFLSGFRTWLDTLCVSVLKVLSDILSFFGMRFVRLLFHYSLHGILKRLLGALRSLENKVEALVRKNRKVATDIQIPKNRTHLDAIAEHKEETALSERQKKKLLSH